MRSIHSIIIVFIFFLERRYSIDLTINYSNWFIRQDSVNFMTALTLSGKALHQYAQYKCYFKFRCWDFNTTNKSSIEVVQLSSYWFSENNLISEFFSSQLVEFINLSIVWNKEEPMKVRLTNKDIRKEWQAGSDSAIG